MNSFGPRRSWQNHPSGAQPDLARRAVIGGGVLTLVLVLGSFVTGFWGSGTPAVEPPAATSSAAALGTDLEPSGKSKKSDSDSDDDKGGSKGSKGSKSDKGKSDKSDKSDSDSDDDSDDSKDSKGSGRSGKKHGSSSSLSSSDGAGVLAGLGDAFSPAGGSSLGSVGGSGSRVLPPNFSVPTRRTSAGLGGLSGSSGAAGGGASSGSDPGFGSDSSASTGTGRATDVNRPSAGLGGGYARSASGSTTCTTVVGDRAGLDRALQNAGPDDVVCMRAGARAASGTGGLVGGSGGLSSSAGGLSGGAGGLPAGFGGAATDAGRTSPYVGRSDSGSHTITSHVGPGQSTGNISLGSGSGGDGKCTQEVTDSAGFERALRGARDGDKVCIGVGDLGVRLEVGKGGASGLSIQIAGLGALSSRGLRIQTDDVQAEHNNIGRINTN